MHERSAAPEEREIRTCRPLYTRTGLVGKQPGQRHHGASFVFVEHDQDAVDDHDDDHHAVDDDDEHVVDDDDGDGRALTTSAVFADPEVVKGFAAGL